jgi:hypothetical protein
MAIVLRPVRGSSGLRSVDGGAGAKRPAPAANRFDGTYALVSTAKLIDTVNDGKRLIR